MDQAVSNRVAAGENVPGLTGSEAIVTGLKRAAMARPTGFATRWPWTISSIMHGACRRR